MDRTPACRARSGGRTHIDSQTPSCQRSHCLAQGPERSTTVAPRARTNSICQASYFSFFAAPRHSAIEPDRHTGLEPGRIALRIEAQAQRIAIVIADRALRLPGRERPNRPKLGDSGGYRFAPALS